jgi:eukaryotic-like serine/threonine-protein kinase
VTAATLQNAELIPGYITTERIGSGGYGEVWRAEAPGGFEKAIKVVYGFHDDERATRELKALERIKRVRHPFVLSVERAEIVDGRLAILTELADKSLDQRFEECRSEGLPGIPREELLGYMRDAADALDYLLREHVLQHLDIKPENLLLVAGHVKVADFGLIKRVSERTEHSMVGGMTPTYAAPEIFDGRPSSYSDQYSLAIVYQEMLTGTLPFPGRTSAQLALQHTQGRPILTALSATDREVVARALSKNPTDRFPTSRELVAALSGLQNRVAADRQPEQNDDTKPPAEEEDGIDTKSLASGATQCVTTPSGTRPPSRPVHEVIRTEAIGRISDSSPVVAVAKPAPEAAPIHVSTAVVDAPVPTVEVQDSRVRPTLYVGIGGVAARVLARLREKMAGSETSDSEDVLPMLLVDTDRSTLQAASSGLFGEPLHSGELCHLPLRKSQQYRDESPKLLNWLSRRWLYNIPRSLQTRGFRPLGRLAMIDHTERLLEALETRLKHLYELAQSRPAEDPHGQGEDGRRARVPRVVLVASSDGGTGAGMVVDVAFAVRSLAGRLKLANLEICGVLAHATGRQQEQTELALANTYSLLSEIGTVHRSGYHSSQTPDPRTACYEGDGLPFDDLYFVHLGDELTEPQFADAVELAGDYLYNEACSPLGEMLQRCRKTAPPAGDAPEGDVRVRSFSLATVRPDESLEADAMDPGDRADREDERGHTLILPASGVLDDSAPIAEPENDSPGVASVSPDVVSDSPESELSTPSPLLPEVCQEEPPPEEPEGPGIEAALEAALAQAALQLTECGYTRRRIVLAPRGEDAAELTAIANRAAPGSAVVAASVDAPTVLCEAAGLSLAQLAAKLIESRPDVAEAAHRLHTRSDIEWQPLPRVVPAD